MGPQLRSYAARMLGVLSGALGLYGVAQAASGHAGWLGPVVAAVVAGVAAIGLDYIDQGS